MPLSALAPLSAMGPLSILSAGSVLPRTTLGPRSFAQGTDDCQRAKDGAAFIQALEQFRAGDADALRELMSSASRLGHGCGRWDAADIAGFYASLSTEERAAGLAAEAELDALREDASQVDPELDAELERLTRRAESLSLRTAELRDTPVHAHVITLVARLRMRGLERSEENADEPGVGRKVQHTRDLAAEAVRLFEGAGQVTPTLEPHWIGARGALLAGDLGSAETSFLRVADLAGEVTRPLWRERGLLGAIGVARMRGSVFEAGLLLEDLASFRDPSTCWSLAREVAVQRITADDGDGALEWLRRFPPSADDPEVALSDAREEWRALVAAANLRIGRVDLAAEHLAPRSLAPMPHQPGSNGPTPGAVDLTQLARAAVHLEAGEPALALEVLGANPLRPSGQRSKLGLTQTEALVLRGRALLDLGRPAEAVSVLEEAVGQATRAAEPGGTREGDSSVEYGAGRQRTTSASRVGEWLGLSAVETLASAYVQLADPLEAAAVIEAAHAPTLRRAECRSEISRLAQSSTLGLLTWIVGADRALAVYVDRTGIAAAMSIEVGRKDLDRGATRLRNALRSASWPGEALDASVREPWRALAHEFARALLPPEALFAIASAGATPASIVLLPHGVLERVPFEALVTEPDGVPLGIRLALSVRTQLREAGFAAAPLSPSRARWTGIGAPTGPWEDLPGAREELASLASMWPRWESLSGEYATQEAAASALAGGGPVHVASHVVPIEASDSVGEASVAPLAIALAGGATLSVDAIRNLGPRLPLAVLTACGSADGAAIDGLSVRGVAQAFLDSGTRSTLVTMWPIEDSAGARASLRLHAALMAGASPAEAARRAREFLMELGEPPSEWAAYRCLE